MIPPGKTTLFRMQLAAQNEATRIEISQDGRVREKLLAAPMPGQVALRDDFAGIVRLIDIIMSDAAILERLNQRMRTSVPSPLVGEGQGGGSSGIVSASTPLPSLLPQGEREQQDDAEIEPADEQGVATT